MPSYHRDFLSGLETYMVHTLSLAFFISHIYSFRTFLYSSLFISVRKLLALLPAFLILLRDLFTSLIHHGDFSLYDFAYIPNALVHAYCFILFVCDLSSSTILPKSICLLIAFAVFTFFMHFFLCGLVCAIVVSTYWRSILRPRRTGFQLIIVFRTMPTGAIAVTVFVLWSNFRQSLH